MNIIVSLTNEELEEMGMDSQELKESIIEDLNSRKTYPGFTVIVTD